MDVLHLDDGRKRCPWSNSGLSEAYVRYHDEEWGVPVHDDRKQFEFLILEGAQAGLSWSTILNKRAGYREAFEDFDAERVARRGGLGPLKLVHRQHVRRREGVVHQ